MLIGDPPFTGSTAQAIIAKVMTEKPAGVRRQRERACPDEVEDAVLTALEKLPADRFATPAEFAAALNGARGGQTVALRPVRPAPLRPAPATSSPEPWRSLALGVARRRLARGTRRTPASVIFLQRTFRSEAIYNARFAPDGRPSCTAPRRRRALPSVFVVRPDYPAAEAARPQRDPPARRVVQGRAGRPGPGGVPAASSLPGTLARVPLGGGAPREVLDSVREADWSPDGSELAIIHDVSGRDRLEFPIGKVLYEGSGYLSDPRVSPDGRHVAFAEHPFRWDDRGTVKIVDRAGKAMAVTRDFQAIEGVAWRPRGDEVLFSAYDSSGFVVRAMSSTDGSGSR